MLTKLVKGQEIKEDILKEIKDDILGLTQKVESYATSIKLLENHFG